MKSKGKRWGNNLAHPKVLAWCPHMTHTGHTDDISTWYRLYTDLARRGMNNIARDIVR